MTTTRVFQSGNSQAVRIPLEFQFDVTELEIFRRGNEIVLRPKMQTIEEAFHLLAGMSDDFMAEGRQDTLPQKRNFEA